MAVVFSVDINETSPGATQFSKRTWKIILHLNKLKGHWIKIFIERIVWEISCEWRFICDLNLMVVLFGFSSNYSVRRIVYFCEILVDSIYN